MFLKSNFVVKSLLKKKLKISIAESCTGGLLSSKITSVSGSSKVFNLGLVTYSNKSKVKLLKISKKMIRKYGAVSEQVCLAMTKSIGKIGKTRVSIAITGIAGPGGGTKKKPVGLVYIGVKKDKRVVVKKFIFEGKNRNHIQKIAANKSLELILGAIK